METPSRTNVFPLHPDTQGFVIITILRTVTYAFFTELDTESHDGAATVKTSGNPDEACVFTDEVDALTGKALLEGWGLRPAAVVSLRTARTLTGRGAA